MYINNTLYDLLLLLKYPTIKEVIISYSDLKPKMVELRKVSSMTSEDINELRETAIKLAKEI